MAKGKFDMSEFLKPAAVSNQDTGREQIVYLPLDQLRADENNFYSLDGIDELAANIELIGLQQPIRARKDGDGYIIVSGHRRSAALRLLVEDGQKRFAEAPCIIASSLSTRILIRSLSICGRRRRSTSPLRMSCPILPRASKSALRRSTRVEKTCRRLKS